MIIPRYTFDEVAARAYLSAVQTWRSTEPADDTDHPLDTDKLAFDVPDLDLMCRRTLGVDDVTALLDIAQTKGWISGPATLGLLHVPNENGAGTWTYTATVSPFGLHLDTGRLPIESITHPTGEGVPFAVDVLGLAVAHINAELMNLDDVAAHLVGGAHHTRV